MILPSGASTTDYSRLANSRGWGAGWRACDAINSGQMAQVRAQRSGSVIAGGVHRGIQQLVQIIIDEMERQGYLLHPGWSWGAECRQISGTNTPSNHSWGLAIDLNAPNNPYTSSGQHDIPDWAFALWRRYGFGCGADYSGKKDWMHVEMMGTPGDADIMTALALREFGGNTATPPTIKKDWFDMAEIADLEAVVKKLMPTADQIAAAVWSRPLNVFRPVASETDKRAGDLLAAIDQRAQSLPTDDSVGGQVWSRPLDAYRAGLTEDQRRAGNLLASVDYGVSGAGVVAPPAPPPASATGQYTVKAGDGFDAIAKQYGTDRAGLQRLNPDVTDVSNIYVGQVLIVPK